MSGDRHIEDTISTYNVIAKDYGVIATPENRTWLESSMQLFAEYLSGKKVLVAGCGEGRDSRFLWSLGLSITSFDLSDSMLAVARREDPEGVYVKHDLRELSALGRFDGIWACACLYHLTKQEFADCIKAIWNSLNSGGMLFCNLKMGEGEQYLDQPRAGYPGGKEAKEKLAGRRFYSFYSLSELEAYFSRFELLQKRKDLLKEGQGAMEFWLKKP